MKLFCLALVALVPVFSLAQTSTSTENLASLSAALNRVIAEKSQIAGVEEVPSKITPPGEEVLKQLSNDLELCQSSKSNEPELVVVEEDGVSIKLKKFDLRIYGDKCPLEISASLKANEQTNVKFDGVFALKVVFKSESYIQKYKMKFIEMNGVFKANAEKKGAVVHLPVHVKISGQSESTELGLIQQEMSYDITIDANLAQFNFNVLAEQRAQISFGGKTQKGYSRSKMAGFSQPEVVYQIDEQNVSESEFQTFLQTFVLPDLVSEEDPDAPDNKVSSQCTVLAYDKKKVSAAVLKQQMLSSNLQSDGQLLRGQVCMSGAPLPYTQDGRSYQAQVTFGEEWISFLSQSKGGTEKSASVFVLYKDDAPLTKETETQVLGLQCRPVPTCQ